MNKEDLIVALYKSLATQYMHDFVKQFGESVLNETPIVISQAFGGKQIADFKLKKVLFLNSESLRDVHRGLSVFILETSIPEAN